MAMGGDVKVSMLLFALALAAVPVMAEDVPFNGRILDVAADQDARPILRMVGSRYSFPRQPEQTISQAQACLAGQGGVTVVSADPEQGQLVATLRVDYRAVFSARAISSRMQLEAGPGYFQITQTDLGDAAGSFGGDQTDAPTPLTQKSGGWEKALDALVQSENKLVDCLYR